MSDLLDAIVSLQTRMDQRFDRVDEKVEGISTRVTKVEQDLSVVKAVGTMVTGFATFLGWDSMKLWFGIK